GHTPPGFEVTQGRIDFDGKNLLSLGAREWRGLLGRRIAFIPQEPLTALNPVLTIGQTFDEHLMLLGIAAGRRKDLIVAQLASVKLPHPEQMVRRYPHELSGGQCQRVLIAMAFVANPSLIIADEPTTALDVVSQAHILSLLAEQQRQHETAVILITHDLRLAAHVCDDIAVLYAGEQVEYGPAADVLREPRHPYTWALHDATPDVHGVQRVLPMLGGQMPGLSALATLGGCRFAARCPTRNATCETGARTLRESSPGHWVRCADNCGVAPHAVGAVDDSVTAAGAANWIAPQGDPVAAPLVELRNVTLRYTARRGLLGQRHVHTDAVSQVSLKVQPGEFVGIVGESGSGKTSVARLIVGAENITAGELLIEGQDRAKAASTVQRLTREHVQMIFQDPHSALNPRRSVFRLLTQAYEVDHIPGALQRLPRQERASQLLRDVGLAPDALERFPSQLSGGQKQRVNIGRALCVMPRLVVADEIVSGLDVSIQAQILNLLLELGREHGIALLLISHDLSVVRYLCSRVIVMQSGKIVEEGKTDEVFANPQHAYTRLLLASVPPADPAIAWPPATAITETA
ncbi:MAG: oligopeptide/dipeptide transporter, ATPase subunit, partial [Variovorax sp.]|nr:oligopeptide/dipeptide transporter, ATPase subunit [Variovorax sp.]